MNVAPVNSKTSFTSSRFRVVDELGNVINCNYTNLNREDIDWKKFAQFLDDRYTSQNRVKINLFGCSDGSDAYTLTLNLIKTLGEKAKKFFPIFASDISENMIKTANTREILLHDKDLAYLKKLHAGDMFEREKDKPSQIMRGIELYPYKVSNDLKSKVNFSVKDVIEETATHDFSNEVFIFRNGWTFNDLKNQKKIVRNLYQNSNSKTLALIGQSDLFKSGASDFMQENGFRGIKSDVYTAMETNYPSKSIGQPPEPAKYPEYILFERV